ncbi:MAG: TPM domain-containing protein [Alphaproteobacteria bacterium]|nr:TPM domain-containing protein [Alphaproteobacteria bacterium]
MKHLTHDERARLHAACEASEARTSARLVAVAVPVSDRYALFPLVYAGVAGLTVVGAMALFWPALPLREAFFAAAVAAAVVAFVLDWLPLRLMSVPRHIKHAHARDMAHRAFAARILAQTDRKIGILLFVSLGERYVEVVTDRDVDLRVPQETWDAIIARFTAEAKNGRIAEGLLDATEACTKVLEEHYPPA